VRAANPALCQLLQQSPEQLVGRNIGNLGARGYESATQRPQVMTGPVRLPLQRPDSTTAWADVTITPTRAGSSADSSELLAQFVDVTDELHARDQLLFAARHDPLTGLLNRDQVVEMLSDHLDASPGSEVLVMAIGLDNFKIVNEAFGHSVGDQVLSTTASRITKLAETDGWAGRVGADEFVLTMLVPAGDPDAAAKATVESVMTNLEQPIDVGDFLLRVGVCVGAVVSRSATPQNPADRPSAPQPADDPLTNASAALRAAKSSGGGRWQMYDDSMRRAARARLQLLNDMNRTLEGLDDSRFLTWFQPIVNLASGAVFGYEALARWERQGVIMPAGQWIKTAEHDAAIIHRIAMQTAEDAARFAATLPAGAHISINVSGAHINSRYFAEFVERLTDLAPKASPARLSLEITETALARITKSVQRLLTELTAVGVMLWVDDFGTGYSSLTHLRDLPISGLKLDQSFVSLLDGASPQTARRIAGGVAGLARGLRLDTIAEGVETQRQAAELAQLGWQHGQGWLFGPAQAPDHLPPVSPTRPGCRTARGQPPRRSRHSRAGLRRCHAARST
jgi:diguanylate cyclase (GGDEF)-like protein